MKVLIYEYAVSEGHADEDVSAGILSEGFGMLRVSISDLKRAGHEVTTVISDGLKKINPPLEADSIASADSSEGCRRTLRNLADESDATLVIAPESDGTLHDVVKLAEESDAISLNSTSEAIGVVSDKAMAHDILKEEGLPVPESRTFHLEKGKVEAGEIVKGLSFPLVLKPVEGVGCEDLSVVENRFQTARVLGEMRGSGTGPFLIQKYVEGTAASVGVISNGESAVPLTLNLQRVKLGPPGVPSTYMGGAVPIDHPFKREALNVATEAVEKFDGLKGHVGIDLVLGKDGPVILELNPRLTTSYIGARKVLETNLAQAILEGVLEEKLPRGPRTSGCSFFSKVPLEEVSLEDFQRFSSMKEVISPPFPTSWQTGGCLLALTKNRNLKEAREKFDIFKQSLECRSPRPSTR